MPDFTTGPCTLPDIGELSYNTCEFSPLFESNVSGIFVKDTAGRTTKLIEYTIAVEGYVTRPDNEIDVQDRMDSLEKLLSAQGGALRYKGRGFEIVVNAPGGDSDVAWGPIPEILDFVPMGAGRSAKIKWTIKTRVAPKVLPGNDPVLQFSYDTIVTYDEDGYSSVSLSGIVEVPLTRTRISNRTITETADDFRELFPGRLLATIDLTRFRVTNREFKLSNDKRTLTFNVRMAELSWMAMPPDITIARGTYTFKPASTGLGLVKWLCTLSVTYTVAKGRPRRIAWLAFLALLRERMKAGNTFGSIPTPSGNQNPIPVDNVALVAATPVAVVVVGPLVAAAAAIGLWQNRTRAPEGPPPRKRNVFLVDLSGIEGLYTDAKTMTFSATWRLTTTFDTILLASGLWKKVPAHSENAWATSMSGISGAQSWLRNNVDPADDAIVDFGT